MYIVFERPHTEKCIFGIGLITQIITIEGNTHDLMLVLVRASWYIVRVPSSCRPFCVLLATIFRIWLSLHWYNV